MFHVHTIAAASQFSQHILTHSENNAGSQESKYSGSDFNNSKEDTYEKDDYDPSSESDMPAQKHYAKKVVHP